MKKTIIIPDSYKGTLSAIQICDIMKKSIQSFYPECETITIPVADGGEGTVDCFVYSVQAEKIPVKTTGPFDEPITACYARTGDTAIFEMASTAGLPLAENRLDPCKATTYGLGTLLRHAIDSGCTELVIGLGGSCTNDGGTGLAAALGTAFYDTDGNTFIPSGDTLTKIANIDTTETKQLLDGCTITAMCDIDNPMYGPQGAAYIFSPQKGADEDTVLLLDDNLKALAETIKNTLGQDVSSLPGSGAAGALGAGIVAFLGGSLKPGIDTILDLIKFDELLPGTDMVFTGEGRIDSQTLHGKVIMGVSARAKLHNIPVTVVAGSIDEGIDKIYDHGVSAIFSINRRAIDFSQSRYSSDKNLKLTMDDLLRFYKTVQ